MENGIHHGGTEGAKGEHGSLFAEAAFPSPGMVDGYGSIFWAAEYGQGGMSLVDYFAGQALAATLANHDVRAISGRVQFVAEMAWEIAEAMMRERERRLAACVTAGNGADGTNGADGSNGAAAERGGTGAAVPQVYGFTFEVFAEAFLVEVEDEALCRECFAACGGDAGLEEEIYGHASDAIAGWVEWWLKERVKAGVTTDGADGADGEGR